MSRYDLLLPYGIVLGARVPVTDHMFQFSWQSVLAESYVTRDGRFGISYQLPDKNYWITSQSSSVLGFADSWRACRFFANAGRNPGLRVGADEISTAELLAQAVRAGLDGTALADEMQKQLRIDLGIGDPTIRNVMARVVSTEVPVVVWLRLWDRLADQDEALLANLAEEYLEECEVRGLDVDDEMVRRMRSSNLLFA